MVGLGTRLGVGSVRRGRATFVGPLDALSGQLYAVIGPHRALSSYAGPCYRVRRSSDAAETDIGFDANGWVSAAALLSAAGGGTLTVARDYDKTGQGHDGVQTTGADQWTIVSEGVVNVGPNGHPCPVLDGNGDHVRLANSAGYSRNQAALTMAAIACRTGANALNETQAIVQCIGNSTTRVGFALWISTYALTVWGRHPDDVFSATYNGGATTLNAWQRYIGRARATDGAADTVVNGALSTGAWGAPAAFSDTDQNGDVYVGTTNGGGAIKGFLGPTVLMQGSGDLAMFDAGLALMMP